MKEYLKMSDAFEDGQVTSDGMELWDESGWIGDLLNHKYAEYSAHAINSHDDLVAEVERLRESLRWAVNNLPFENAFEWSDDENADAHYEALKLLGVSIEE